MTSLPTLPGHVPVAAPASPNLVKRMLEPLERAERLGAQLAADVRAIRATVPYSLPAGSAVEPPNVDRVPIETAISQLRKMVMGPTEPRAVRMGFSLMLEALPNASKFDSALYLDALVATILAEPEIERGEYGEYHWGGFPPVVIAAAARRVWREKTFTPSVAEVLEILRAERRRLHSPVVEARLLVDRVARLERQAERHRAERAEFATLLQRARAAGDESFAEDEPEHWAWQSDLERLRRRYGSTTR